MNTLSTMMYNWNTINWRKLEQSVFKLQKRIYQAACREDVKAVHQLQRLLIKSKAAAFLAVRRVTQINRGKNTAGIDGLASLTNKRRLKLVREKMRNPLSPKSKPVRRVWIPKPGKNEKRPLGIPVMADRARQALAKMALEPEWEAKFEPNSYGFRQGRSCHDAVEAIYSSILQAQKYVLDGDITKCFDRINHDALLKKLGTFPVLRRAIKAWLKAGIMDDGKLFPVSEGTPQGGVISPLLANIALHGLETAIRDAFPHSKPLLTCQNRQYRVLRYSSAIRPIIAAESLASIISFSSHGSSTMVLPDHFYRSCFDSFQDSFPLQTHFILCSDAFYSGFSNWQQLWTWLHENAVGLNDNNQREAILEQLHADLHNKSSDDDISFVWVQPKIQSLPNSEGGDSICQQKS